MTFEEKLEIVSKNYADKYIENVNVKNIVHKAYYEGFKDGYKKKLHLSVSRKYIVCGEKLII